MAVGRIFYDMTNAFPSISTAVLDDVVEGAQPPVCEKWFLQHHQGAACWFEPDEKNCSSNHKPVYYRDLRLGPTLSTMDSADLCLCPGALAVS